VTNDAVDPNDYHGNNKTLDGYPHEFVWRWIYTTHMLITPLGIEDGMLAMVTDGMLQYDE
jgi:hypothetical protein